MKPSWSPLKFDYLNPPGDFARIPDPMIAYSLKVLGMDVAGFDAILLGLRDKYGMRVRIGDATQSARWEQASRIGQKPDKEVGGHYRLGKATTTVAGITRCQGVPCALMWYSAEGNAVQQETNTSQLRMRMDGTEYFRAEMAVSLLDGHLVAAE